MDVALEALGPLPATRGIDATVLVGLAQTLRGLRTEMQALEAEGLRGAPDIQPSHVPSARNLLHYLALRRHDLRVPQALLARLGLSSLGRCESCVLANLDAVLQALQQILGQEPVAPAPTEEPISFTEGPALLERRALALFGPPRPQRRVRILVTLPSEAATDPALMESLLAQGMDCARINCAHDDATVWMRMIANLRRAEAGLGRRCPVLMDLAGPKLRTGPVEAGPPVRKLKPERDVFGRVTKPLAVRLVDDSGPDQPPSGPGEVDLSLAPTLLARVAPGDVVEFTDTRGSRRRMRVIEAGIASARAMLEQTAYVTSWLPIRVRRGSKLVGEGSLGRVAGPVGRIRLHAGDLLDLVAGRAPGGDAVRGADGSLIAPAHIGCSLPEVFAHVKVGEPIWFDDGKIAGVIRDVHPDRLRIEILQAGLAGEYLAADKGINLPESRLGLSALTAKDIQDLTFVAAHADAVGLSFVSSPADIHLAEEHLRLLGAPDLGLVLKIETRRAFEHLPELLLASMQRQCQGVMIARGDLAVECGWQRLAEVQEEVLWLCEAAHVPVIWATQVLESLAKQGRPSRAEITDAAMGERAECVMLNKGPHLPLAVQVLGDILHRMQDHQQKKRAMLRPLSVADGPARS